MHSPGLLSDGYLCSAFSLHCHFETPHLHLNHACNFWLDLFLKVFMNELSLIYSNFISTLNLLHLHLFISSHTVSFFSTNSSYLSIWSIKLKLKLRKSGFKVQTNASSSHLPMPCRRRSGESRPSGETGPSGVGNLGLVDADQRSGWTHGSDAAAAAVIVTNQPCRLSQIYPQRELR